MDFSFSEEQRLFADSVGEMLGAELPPEAIRKFWDGDEEIDAALHRRLAEMGLFGMLVAEEHGGLGLDERDFVLIAERCGFAAMPGGAVDAALVGIPLLAALPAAAAHVPDLIAGRRRLAVGDPWQPCLIDAAAADWWLLPGAGEAADAQLRLSAAQPEMIAARQSFNPSRRLFDVAAEAACETLAEGERAREMWARARRRGGLGVAAQLLGATRRMLDMSVAYTAERKQFGAPIGSFQALKHMLADVVVKLEFARPVVHRAAYEIAVDGAAADAHLAHARVAASETALLAAKHCMQAHGAMGYTWEMDLQIWMKFVWSLDKLWGDDHFERVENFLLDADSALGAGATFE